MMVASWASTRQVRERGATVGSLWGALVDLEELDELLAWPPDVFALVDRVLDASEAYRLIVSPPPGANFAGVGDGAAGMAHDWWEWLDDRRDGPPASVVRLWQAAQQATRCRIDDLSAGQDWRVTESLLAFHAVADEACAGLGSALAAPPGPGCRFRAAAREHLAETGSLSRISPDMLLVLPRCRAGATGMSIQSLARHVCVRGPQVDVCWRRMLSRPSGVDAPQGHANLVLLPWPLRVRARDFRPVRYALSHMNEAEFGFFEFGPDEMLDLDMVEQVLGAAEEESGTVDIVVLPESAITPSDIEPLEALLADFGVWCLIAGVREPPVDGQLGANWVHVGVRQHLVWRHARQHKHHRWCLDGRQLKQYHLGGALDSSIRWWEAVTIPRRSLQIIDQGAVTFAPLVCEDLARMEPVADLLRSIGPSIVITLLLDGPQLTSRWTARYASVLADDAGSAVLTLTSYGMVQRCRPPGRAPSNVIALWKDATGELTEISLEDGAQAVLIATTLTTTGSVTADGRRHAPRSSCLSLAAVQSLRVADDHAPRTPHDQDPREAWRRRTGLPGLEEREATKATSWSEAFAELAVVEPQQLDELMADAVALDWRESLGLRRPSALFVESVRVLRRELPLPLTLEGVVVTLARLCRDEDPVAAVAARALAIALEQRLLVEVRTGRQLPETLRLFTDAAVIPGRSRPDSGSRCPAVSCPSATRPATAEGGT
jgi:hypothetical protein